MKLEQLQCSARRVDNNTVLISCGEAFLKTDNKGVAEMVKVLNRLLAGCQAAEESDLCQTTPQTDTCSEKSAGVSALVAKPPHPSCRNQIQNTSPSHRPHNVVHLFAVASYKTGWPFSRQKLPIPAMAGEAI